MTSLKCAAPPECSLFCQRPLTRKQTLSGSASCTSLTSPGPVTHSVGCNNITGDAASHLAKVVLEHAVMTNFCEIPLASLRENSITELSLYNMGVGVPGAIVLSKLLPSAAALTSLKCACRPRGCSVSCQRPLTRLLSHHVPPPPLAHSLAENEIGDEGASALAAVLKETKITNLKCAAAPECLIFLSAPADKKGCVPKRTLCGSPELSAHPLSYYIALCTLMMQCLLERHHGRRCRPSGQSGAGARHYDRVLWDPARLFAREQHHGARPDE